MAIKKSILFLILLLFTGCSASLPQFLSSDWSTIDDFEKNEFFIDSTNTISTPENLPQKLDTIYFKAIKPHSSYWIKINFFKVIDEPIVMNCFFSHDLVEIFYYENGIYKSKKTGFAFPNEEREILVESHSILLPLESQKYPIYAHIITSSLPKAVGFNYYKESTFINFLTFAEAGHVVFLSVLVVFIFICFAFYIVLKDRMYFIYAAYLFFFMSYAFVDWGYISLVAGKIHFNFYEYFFSIPYVMMTIMLILYIRCFIPKHLNFIKTKLTTGLILIRFITFIVGLYFNAIWLHDEIIDTLICLALLVSCIYIQFKEKTNIKYLCFGLSILFLGYLFQYSYLFSIDIDKRYFFYTNGLIETIFFTLALASRYKLEILEKHEAMAELIQVKIESNELLESKIKSRTDELLKVTEQLQTANQKIQNENLEIKTSIHEEKVARVFRLEVTFDEFKKTFATEDDCYKFLVDLKWASSFECKKCNAHDFTLLRDNYNRKCRKCQTISSPTSETLFHGIKIPIDKAFYILFLTTSGKNYTVEDLSSMVSLRVATCWSFRKKVEIAMESKKFYKKTSMTWKDLII